MMNQFYDDKKQDYLYQLMLKQYQSSNVLDYDIIRQEKYIFYMKHRRRSYVIVLLDMKNSLYHQSIKQFPQKYLYKRLHILKFLKI